MKRILAIVLSIAILVMAFPFSVFAADQSIATDTWDGTTVEPTTTDADGNIVINTAEELAWIALKGDSATAGKSYKVADGITAFYLTPNGTSSYDNSSFDKLKETLSSDNDLLGDTLNKWHCMAYVANVGWASFQGSFDGNGITIYGMPGYAPDSYGTNGLFPYIKGDVSFKNFILTDSYVSSIYNVGGIVGAGAGNASVINTLSIEKCAVTGTYFEQRQTNSAESWSSVAALVGSVATITTSLNINNCISVENFVDDINGRKARGFIGYNYKTDGTDSSIENSITDFNPYNSGYYACIQAGFSNVYTTCTDSPEWGTFSEDKIKILTAAEMQGAAAQTNMSLAWNTDWIVGAEGEYPSINFGEPVRDPYVWDGSFEEPTETDDEGNIIINTVQEMAWVALRGATATAGKSYKVADGIESFDMNGSVGITADSTAAEVQAATRTGNNWRYATDGGSGYAFQGNFDGNGVTIYNIYSAGYGYGALFPYIYNDSTIKNVIVKASFLSGYHCSAGIVGNGELTKTININKCAVENCYITDNGNQNAACKRAAAQFVAGTGNSNVNISNCFAANNTLSAAGFEAGFVGTSGNYIPTGISITNSISIGMYPYSNAKIGALGNGLTEKLTVENVYSDVECDVAGFTTLTTDKMQGEAAKSNMNLAWGTNWLTGAEGEYPVIYYGEPIKDPYVWDGTFTEPTETDDEGNIIINTASELAWIALRGGDATTGKNYKVADGIKCFNMNGFVGITADSTVADVKAAAKTGNNWCYADSRTGTFYGNFDGNGVTVYNIYTNTGRGYGGLFPITTPATATTPQVIKNVSVYASHIGGYHYAGGIVGFAECNTTSSIVNFEGCVVKNCYIYDNDDTNSACNRTVGTIVGALSHNGFTINNCAAIDNQLSAQGIIGGLAGDKSAYGGEITIKNSISIGTSVQPLAVLKVPSTKFATATYTNVYTDQIASADGITTLTTEQMQGAAAKDNMSLNWGINWAVGAEGEYPSIITDNAFYDEWDGSFSEPTKTDAEGNIIISTAEEMAWVALRGDTATAGKNYKVADGIKYFNMSGMAGITANSTVNDVENATKDNAKSWSYAADGKVGTFYGNFDGNGVTIYNVYTKPGLGYGGLFPVVKPASGEMLTIKNVAIVASYIGGYHNSGAIIGLADAPDTSTKLSIENVIVKNSYMYDNNDANPATQRTAGVLVGNLTHNAATINNIFASGNELSAQGIIGGLFGNSSAYASASTVSNVISIGTAVEPASVGNSVSDNVANTVYENVYTDIASTNEAVTTLTVDEMNGANLTLDWSGWFATTGLPELRVFHDVTSTDNGDGTHSNVCSECELGGINTPHSFENGLCALCGAECVHEAGDPVVENRIEATCVAEGSYDLVVYCSVCGFEISKTTETIDINPDAHTYDNDSDKDCNNGCGYVRINYGDSNNDGEINNKDIAVTMQYINGWDVEIDVDAADVNCDGKVNNKDYALIMQYINGWDVELG